MAKNELNVTVKKAVKGGKVGFLVKGGAEFDDVSDYAGAIRNMLATISGASKDAELAVALGVTAFMESEIEKDGFPIFNGGDVFGND